MAQNSSLLGGMGTPPTGEASAPADALAAPPPAPSVPDQMLSQAKARFAAVAKATKQFGQIRKGLDALVAKGDAVTSDDVLDEMATLVSHGLDPKALAAMIAGNTEAGVGPMPPSGAPLAGWLTTAEKDIVAPMEAKLRPAMALAQHQLGVAAVHKLVEVHSKAQGGRGPSAPSAPSEATSPMLGGASLPAPTSPAPSLLQ